MHSNTLYSYARESRRKEAFLFNIYYRHAIASSYIQPPIIPHKQIPDTLIPGKIGEISNLNERPHYAILPKVYHIIFIDHHQHIAVGNVANHPYGRSTQTIYFADAPNGQLLFIYGQ